MSTTRWLSESEQRTWRAYLEMTARLRELVESQLQHDADIPHGYYEILVALSEAPCRTLRMRDLARSCYSSRSRLSHAVARLEARGWIRRTDCPTDRRGQLATLTDDGFAALAAAAPGHVEQVRRLLFDPLSAEQLAALDDAAATVLAALGERPDGIAEG